MAEKLSNDQKITLSDQENLKEKIELQEKKWAELENASYYRIYAYDSSEEHIKKEIEQKRINKIKNLYGF